MGRSYERGSALLVALGILVLLSMMGVTFVIFTQMERRAAENFDDISRARLLAMSGAELAISKMLEGYYGPFLGNPNVANTYYESSPVDSLAEPWAQCCIRLVATGAGVYFDAEQVAERDPDGSPRRSLCSGPIQGRLGHGYFDLRRRYGTRPDAGTAWRLGPLERGIVDLNSRININTANETLIFNMLTVLRTYVWDSEAELPGPWVPEQWSQAIVNLRRAGPSPEDSFPYPGNDNYRPYRYPGEVRDRAGLPTWVLCGADANNNGIAESGEDWDSMMPGLMEFVTLHPIPDTASPLSSQRAFVSARVFRPSSLGGSNDYSPNERWVTPVNVNTASAPVIAAVLFECGLGRSRALTLTEAWTFALVFVDYRNGIDNIDGIASAAVSYHGHSDSANNPDDNPFDGWDGHRDAGTPLNGPGWDDESVTVVANYTVLDPYVFNFRRDDVDNSAEGYADDSTDAIDNDGDGTADEPDEQRDPYIFPGGYNGFAELETVIESDPSVPHPLVGGDRELLDYVKANASTRKDIDFDEDGSVGVWERGCWTTPFRYDSTDWLIISEGVMEKGGKRRAVARVMSIVAY